MSNQENDARFAQLEQFSTEELEELLRGDIASPEQGDDALVFRILEVIQSREASPDAQQKTQAAWERFQSCYRTPEGENQSLYPSPAPQKEDGPRPAPQKAPPSAGTPVRGRGYRCMAFAVAVIATLLVGLVTAQAAGLDVFGAIAQWSDDTFGFTPTSEGPRPGDRRPPLPPQEQEYVSEIQTGLAELHLPLDLAPTWFPEGYTMGEMEVTRLPQWNTVYCSFTNDSGGFFSIQIDDYFDPSALENLIFEKDDTPVEEYFSHNREFYILSNLDTLTAAWSDGRLVHSIAGSLTREDFKQIIDSMGEQS